MPAARLVLIRHGQSVWNAERRWQGQGGPGLTVLGHRQAEATAAHLCSTEPDIRSLVTSDLPRVTETAAPAERMLGRRAHRDPRVREIDVGWWSGLRREELVERDPDAIARLAEGHDVARGGAETHADLAARVRPAIAEIVASCDGGAAVVFAHGGPIRAVVEGVLGLDGDAGRQLAGPANCSVTLVLTGGDWRVRQYGGAGHLPAGLRTDATATDAARRD